MLARPYDSPWLTNYQKQADDALAIAQSATADQLRALRPPLPQIVMDPPRFGYPPYAERQWDVLQVFGISRTPSGNIPAMPRSQEDRVDYSRSQSADQGSDRNSLNDALGMGAGGSA